MKNSLFSALKDEKPLQIAGTINAYSALLAEREGFKAIYLSGAGVANASLGLPDLAISNLNDVVTDVARITSVCDLPLLVDIDTGWGTAFNIARTIKEIYRAGAAGVHIEDQVSAKRCGHRPGKELVSPQEMVDRIKSAVDAKENDEFVVMARTDALAGEGLDSAMERCVAYVAAGADMIFAEAVQDLPDYKKFANACQVPILANMTEFGKTPIYSLEEFAQNDVSLVLYPLSAFRAMSKSAELIYSEIKKTGSQEKVLDKMQTRKELYEVLKYYDYEKKIDKLFNGKK